MAFDEEHLIRAVLHDVVYGAGQALQLGVLIGSNFPGSGLEADVKQFNPAHALAQLKTLTDLLERIAAGQGFDGWGCKRLVDIVFGRRTVINNVLLLGKLDHGRGKVHKGCTQTHQPSAIEWSIIKENDVATIARAPVTAQRAPLRVHLRKDPRTVAGVEAQCNGVAMPCVTRSARSAS